MGSAGSAVRRLLAGWLLAAVLVLVLLVVVLTFTGTSRYSPAGTWKVVKLVQTGQVTSAVFDDQAQVIQVTTRTGARYQAAWAGDQGSELAALLQQQSDAGQLPGGYNVLGPRGRSLPGWLPFAVIVLLFFAVRNVMRGGSRAMTSGTPRARPITKDTPPEPDSAINHPAPGGSSGNHSR